MRLLVLTALFAAAGHAGPLTEGRTGDARSRKVRAGGGSAATEAAVGRALAWLAQHQSAAGTWDADGFMRVANEGQGCDCDGKGGGWHGEAVPCPFDMELTALATLAFLRAGHTHKQGAHKEVVARALSSLRTAGDTLFATAYATQALAEAFDMTGDRALRDRVEAGVALMVRSRQPEAGWRYSPGMGMAAGVPTTTAVVVALETARRAGFTVDDGYRAPIREWLGGLIDSKTGRVKYHVGSERLGYTPTTTNAASALWMLVSLGDRHPAPLTGALAKKRPRWSIRVKRMKVKGVERDVQLGSLQHYYWWHGTEALARVGGPSWKAWNGALKKALLSHQEAQGHATGSWDPVGTYGKVGGRVFSTALCALALQCYVVR